MMFNHLLPFFLPKGEEPPELTLTHTYTITVASGRGQIGYWFNNIGSITEATFTIPNGSAATIRQTMVAGGVGANQMRWLMFSGANINVNTIDQFPVEIKIISGGRSAIAIMQNPVEISSFGQGIGVDYSLSDAGVALFVAGATLTVELYY